MYHPLLGNVSFLKLKTMYPMKVTIYNAEINFAISSTL